MHPISSFLPICLVVTQYGVMILLRVIWFRMLGTSGTHLVLPLAGSSLQS